MSSEVAIAVHDVSKVYQLYAQPQDRLKQMLWRGRRKFHDDFWALKGISFEVKKGETVGIIGKNGSGKSTLLQIICGTIIPTTGTVQRKGRISALLELGSGFNPEFTGRENVYLNGSILGMNRSEMNDRFEKIAAFADIGQFMDSPVKHYSSGMFARLAFSVAIHVDPEILIVDEILAVGDVAFQRKCLNKFYEIRESGCSILFVSHDQYQVKSICQRALYLVQGCQKLFGPAGHVIDEYMIDTEERVAVNRVGSGLDNNALLEVGGDLQGSTGDQSEMAKVKAGGAAHLQSTSLPPALSTADGDRLFQITNVVLIDDHDVLLDAVVTGQKVRLQFEFIALVDTPPDKISFVFNLYRHDDVYLCGTTTLMDGMQPHRGARKGRVVLEFPEFPLLSGRYKWRVAINDHVGFVTYAEAKGVCPFRVLDDFRAVGMINLPRLWSFELIY